MRKQDLETLAKGFIDLANAAPRPVKAEPAAPEPCHRRRPPCGACRLLRRKSRRPSRSCRQFRRCRRTSRLVRREKLVLVVQIDATGQGHGGHREGVRAPSLRSHRRAGHARLAVHAGDTERRADPVRAGRDDSAQALTHQRKQNHVANRRAVGQHHHQPVDADPFPTRRRQPVLEGTDVVLVHAVRFFVPARALPKLLLEPPALLDRIVELAEGVRDFEAADIELEPFDGVGIVLPLLRERRDLGRKVVDEYRLDEIALAQRLEDRRRNLPCPASPASPRYRGVPPARRQRRASAGRTR